MVEGPAGRVGEGAVGGKCEAAVGGVSMDGEGGGWQWSVHIGCDDGAAKVAVFSGGKREGGGVWTVVHGEHVDGDGGVGCGVRTIVRAIGKGGGTVEVWGWDVGECAGWSEGERAAASDELVGGGVAFGIAVVSCDVADERSVFEGGEAVIGDEGTGVEMAGDNGVGAEGVDGVASEGAVGGRPVREYVAGVRICGDRKWASIGVDSAGSRD